MHYLEQYSVSETEEGQVQIDVSNRAVLVLPRWKIYLERTKTERLNTEEKCYYKDLLKWNDLIGKEKPRL